MSVKEPIGSVTPTSTVAWKRRNLGGETPPPPEGGPLSFVGGSSPVSLKSGSMRVEARTGPVDLARRSSWRRGPGWPEVEPGLTSSHAFDRAHWCPYAPISTRERIIQFLRSTQFMITCRLRDGMG